MSMTIASRLWKTHSHVIQKNLKGLKSQPWAIGPPHRKMSTGATKLTGRAFYESIGSPKVIVAPMVDRSEFV